MTFKLPKTFSYQIRYIILIPLFFSVFSFLYDPFGVKDYYSDLGGFQHYFHVVMLTCIVFGVMLISRLIFWAVYRNAGDIQLSNYLIWCSCEVIVMAAFNALYTTLFFGGERMYFVVLSYCFQHCAMSLVFPYTIMIMSRTIINLRYELAHREEAAPNMVKFQDDHHNIRLTIDPRHLLYVKAEANYVKIFYVEGEKVKEFILRNSMKSIENSEASNVLVRCHRSYFVNPKYIKLLSKNKEGIIMAELTIEDLNQIPVSKQYYDKIAEIL